MTRWTEDQFTEYMAKRVTIGKDLEKEIPDAGPERELQGKCLQYCRDNGCPAFHDYSRNINDAGWPDLFVFQKGRVVLVELKAAGGKLRKEQEHLKRNLHYLGHTVHVCRSYSKFVRIMTNDN